MLQKDSGRHEHALAGPNLSRKTSSTRGLSPSNNQTPNMMSSFLDIKWDKTLYCYATVECCWHVCLFGACYRFRPISHLQASSWGNALFERLGQKGESFFASNWKRTTSEWFILNKLVGIPLLPAKIALAAAIARHLPSSLTSESR